MNLKSIVSIAVFSASSLGITVLPAQRALAQEIERSTQPIIQYECYNLDGTVAYVTTNPQETIGWQQGCREVPYVVTEPAQSLTTYYQCYDVKGNTLFTTASQQVAEAMEEECKEIGYRDSTPVPINAAYYECYNNQGEVAFTTTRHQDTQGWIPSCREVRTITNAPSINAPSIDVPNQQGQP
ncbi:hypothetical protein IFO70_01325 [Phormidium tenue FACHB-886]|nr:hypothetical protein [Phormidium tenue FACHB-886]